MNSQIVDKFFGALRAADVDSAMSYINDDCVRYDMGTRQVMKGRADKLIVRIEKAILLINKF